MWTQSASATIFCSSNTLPMCTIIEWEWAEQRAREDQELQDTLSKKHSLEFPWGENSFPSLSEFTREHEVRPFFPKYARNLISVLYWWDSMPVTTVLFGYVYFLRSTFLIASTRLHNIFFSCTENFETWQIFLFTPKPTNLIDFSITVDISYNNHCQTFKKIDFIF